MSPGRQHTSPAHHLGDRSAFASPSRRREVAAQLRAAGCVFAEDEAELLVSGAATPGELASMVERRAAGEPVELVVGWAEFCGLNVVVEPGVFIPRRRTECLVQEAVTLARHLSDEGGRAGHRTGMPVVVDLCCGTGALGVALAHALGQVELHAADVDSVAVRCARRNVAPVGGRVHQGDLYQPLPADLQGRVDILVANVPYVPSTTIPTLPTEARDHEPRAALDGGSDGLDVLRRVASGAPRWLAPGGHLLMEVSHRQAQRAVDIVRRSVLLARLVRCDELDATVVVATRPAP